MCESSHAKVSPLHFLWATGPQLFETTSDWLRANPQLQGRVTLVPYLDKMEWAYAVSDGVMAGQALTLAEITALGKPSVLVPLPHSAADHQRGNAQGPRKRRGGPRHEEETQAQRINSFRSSVAWMVLS